MYICVPSQSWRGGEGKTISLAKHISDEIRIYVPTMAGIIIEIFKNVSDI